ncbi:ATP-binding protein [Parabacteroides sp. PF5-9]|uniref:GAF domain-containing sensor histidine kinase n=1 Tax=Parabacteroides sp. PF5-9 TaxID=1742404 RepID=UPI00247564E0|nr:ATP-binding protein [Parabacteroides sp. PF5-9]
MITKVLTLLFRSDKEEDIKKALELLIDHFKADWIYIADFEEKQKNIRLLYKAKSPYTQEKSESETVKEFSTIPWTMEKLLDGQNIVINHIDELPEEAAVDKSYFKSLHFISLLVIPLSVHGQVKGFIGFDYIHSQKQWQQAEVEELKLLANIFSIIIERLHNKESVEEEKRRNEQELQKKFEADKLKSAFLANMSHEIRTPLNAIVGFSGIITEIEDIEERRNYQEIINKNNDLLLQLISDILDFASIESGTLSYQYTEVNLKKICTKIHQTYTARRNSNVKFIFDADIHPEITLHTDAQRVMQVILNFISNAYKFTKKGNIVLSYKALSDHILIEVTDTGIGIEQKYHKSIFNRFIKINNFSQGTGLGLTICKMIIKALHGDIGVKSQPDKGSTFWITLPFSPLEQKKNHRKTSAHYLI